MTMNRYWVEFKDSASNRVIVYIYAYSVKQVRDMLPDYDLFIVDQTD